MGELQDSILEHLHHHICFNMFFNKTFEAHCVQILSCSDPRVGTWFIIWLIFPAFQLSSLFFCTTFCTWFGLPHLSIAGISQCVCTHPINLMNIHLLCCAHGDECTGTHDAICNTFATITWNAGFHAWQEQLYALPSTTFNSSCRRVNIVLTKDDIYTLANVVIVRPIVNGFIFAILHNSRICCIGCNSSQGKELS
jgi:hypothetical protein